MEIFKKFLQRISSSETPKETYLGLEFEEGLLKAAVWDLVNGNVEIIAEEQERYTGNLLPDAITAADKLVTRLEEKTQDLKKVIFGIPFEWAEGNKIKSEKQEFLKELCNKLELSPAGFVVIQEALIYFLQKEEGMPVTAILVQILPSEIILTVSKIGKILGLVRKKREGQLGEVIVSALKDFPQIEVLPSRFLLYDGSADLEDVRQDLISFPWLQKVDFLHFPKIDILTGGTDLKAIVYSGVAEMTKVEKVKFLGEEKSEVINTPSPAVVDNSPKEDTQPIDAVNELETEEKNMPEAPSLAVVNDLAEVGFVADKDILEVKEKKPFVEEQTVVANQEDDFNLDTPHLDESTREGQKNNLLNLKNVTDSFKGFFMAIKLSKFKFRRVHVHFYKSKISTGFLLPVVGSVLLLVVGMAFYWSVVKAEVTLVVEPREVAKSAEIIVSKQAPLLDESKKIIPGKMVEVVKSGSKSTSTTGIKNVGERAKGQVTIYNKTSSSKLFTAGTVLTVDDLEFTLDSSASVSAQKVEETSGGASIAYGKQTVDITAAAIGAKHNVAAGTKFQIDGFASSSYEAKNDQALSGGSSREIAVVTKTDMDNLLASLSAELLEKGKQEFSQKEEVEQRLITEVSEKEIIKQDFDKEVGTEGEQLTLDLEEKFSVLSYNNQDVKSLMGKLIDPEVPQGYTYSQPHTENQVVVKTVNEDETVTLSVSTKAKLLPKIIPEEIQKALSGKSYAAGQKYLSEIKNIKKYETKITPQLPGFLNAFPRISQNIKVIVSGQ